MPDTTSKLKFGRPRHFDNALYYMTSKWISKYDTETNKPLIFMLKWSTGESVLHFHYVHLDDIVEYYGDLAIKLVPFEPPPLSGMKWMLDK